MKLFTLSSPPLSTRSLLELSHSLSSEYAVFSPSSAIVRSILDGRVHVRGEISYTTYEISYVMMEALLLLLITLGIVYISKSQNLTPWVWKVSAALLSRPADGKTPPLDICPHYQLPPLKAATSPHMTMGLKRLDDDNWLTMDETYLEEHSIRAALLSNHQPDVLQCLPGSEAACSEVLSTVVNFLTARYPSMFALSGPKSARMVHNLKTGEDYLITGNSRPLETAARLAMEDFNILVKDAADGEYHLQASATLFPAGWKLQDRVGGTMAVLHAPVPKWQEKLGCSVNRYFDHLSQTSAMERGTFFVQTSPTLFQRDPMALVTSATETAAASPTCPFSAVPQPPLPDITTPTLPPHAIHLRRERQTFTSLPLPPGSPKTILFTVRTYMMPLTSHSIPELQAIVDTALTWGAGMASYKGRENWLGSVEKYLDERKKKELESGKGEV